MEYQIDKDALLARVEEEVSHIADASYADTGQSLYDTIVITEKDRAWVSRLIQSAIRTLTVRVFQLCTRVDDRLLFFVPDFDETMTDAVTDELTNFFVYQPVAVICQSRKAERAQEYANRAQEAIDKAAILLHSRKHPE